MAIRYLNEASNPAAAEMQYTIYIQFINYEGDVTEEYPVIMCKTLRWAKSCLTLVRNDANTRYVIKDIAGNIVGTKE